MSELRTHVVSACLALVLAACGAAGARPRQCRSNSDCAADAHCGADGACVASAPAVAAIAARDGQSAWTGWALDFQASATVDPTSGEHVREYRWSVEGELRDRCMEPEVLADGATFSVVVWCAGEWDVRLSVVDSRGVEAAPVYHHLSLRDPPAGAAAYGPGVEPRDPPVLRLAAPRVEVHHRCAPDAAKPSGWSCGLDAGGGSREVPLVAEASGADGGAVQIAWECAPPEPLRSTAHARLAGATEATARLAVETDDARIAGDYRCIVQIWDARRQTKSAVQVVSVANRPPFLSAAGGTLRVPHRNEGASYRATVAPPAVTVVDPDGDPVSPAAFELRTVRDGATTRSAALEIAVPHADPGGLIGPTVERALVVRTADSHGAAAELGWPVEVTNAAPQRAAFDPAPRVAHRWDGAAYVAAGELGTFVDPEGDPLTLEAVRSDTVCAATLLAGKVRFDCRQPRDAPGALRKLVGTHAFRIPVRDAWSAPLDPATGAALLDDVRVEVLNGTAPAATVATVVLGTAPTGTLPCCEGELDPETRVFRCYARQLDVPAGWRDTAALGFGLDPDGDPLDVVVTTAGDARVALGGGAASRSVSLAVTALLPTVRLSMPAIGGCGIPMPSGTVTVTLDDGTGARTLPAFTVRP